jgi:NADH:ubiquinone reductase (H+-translocating)
MQSPFEPDRTNEMNGYKKPIHETPRDKGQAHRPTVVVLGAGFGGLWATRTFAKHPVNVVLIDRHNYHTFFPLLYQVGAAELEPEEIAQPLRKIFWKQANMRFHLGEVRGIDYSAKAVQLMDHQVHYDYLLVALGSKPNHYGIPGAEEFAFTLKSLEGAVRLRNQILRSFERAACEADPERRRGWLTFVIVGGGATGVEFAGALMELIDGSLQRDFPELDFTQVQVLLLEASDHLLQDLPTPLSDYAGTRLGKMGVQVRLHCPLIRVTPDEVFLQDGSRIPSKTVVWTAGVTGNMVAGREEMAINSHNRMDVLATLQVPGHPEVYVVGDSARIQQDGHPLPMVSQAGIQGGTWAARNILRQLAGQQPLPFRYRDFGSWDVIGRNDAVIHLRGRSIRGFVAWAMWVVLNIYRLNGLRNRLLMMIDWAWAYLFGEHGVRLIVPSETSPGKLRTTAQGSDQAAAGLEQDHPGRRRTERMQSRR